MIEVEISRVYLYLVLYGGIAWNNYEASKLNFDELVISVAHIFDQLLVKFENLY